MFSWTKNSNGLTIYLNGSLHTVPADSFKYNLCIDAIKEDNEESLLDALEKAEKVIELVPDDTNYQVVVSPNGVVFKGRVLNHALSKKILSFYNDGLPYKPLVEFLKKIYENPVFSILDNVAQRELLNISREEAERHVDGFINNLFIFLERHGHPITDDGCFLAYKRVRHDYYDFHSGTVLNAVGTTVSVPREEVDPRRDLECSYGLHVGNLSYSGPQGHFGDQTARCLIVKVDPRDVIRVPNEDSTKMRVCAYDILQEYKTELDKPLYDTSSGVVDEFDDWDNDDDDDDWDDEDEDWYNSDELEVDEIQPNDSISFEYKGESRYLQVENVDDTYVLGVLLKPEKNHGQTRRFQKLGMCNIALIDSI